MVIIKPDSYIAEQPFISTTPAVGQYEIPSQFDTSPVNSPSFKGKYRPSYEEIVMRSFPSPMEYDILESDNDLHWKMSKKRNAAGTLAKEPRKSEFLRTGIPGTTLGHSPQEQWGTTSGATKWHRDSVSPKGTKNTSVFKTSGDTPGPGAFFSDGVPTTMDKRGPKFGTTTRFKLPNGVSQDDWESAVGPGHYSPERSSPSKRMGIEMRGRTYSDMDFVAKERQAVPAPGVYSPERSRRTPPSNQKRGFTMGARLTTTFGASGMGSSNMGSSLFATMTSGSFNTNIGPGSYDIRNSIGSGGQAATIKAGYKPPKREKSPGPGDYISQNDWSRKTSSPAFSFGGRHLPQLKGKRAHARFTSSRSTSPLKKEDNSPGPSSYNIPSSFDVSVSKKKGYSIK